MDDDELIPVLRAEETDATSFYSSELATTQAEAMDRYYGALYGNEIDGRSKITTHDIEDTVNWVMPDLMRALSTGDDLITCTPNRPQDDPNTQPAAQYLRHILFSDNAGMEIIHDFLFDGLVQRLGVVSVLWQDPKPKVPEILEGVSVQQLMEIQADPEYEILEQDEETETLDAEPAPQPAPQAPQAPGAAPGGQPGQAPPQPQLPAPPADPNAPTPLVPITMPTFKLKVQRTPLMGRVHIENVPPEEIAISRRARAFPSAQRGTAQAAGYVRRKQERFLGDVLKEFPDFKDQLESGLAQSGQHSYDMDSDPRVLSRFQNEQVTIGTEVTNSQHRKKVDLLTEYIYIDFDGDGVVELRRVVRVENTILDNVAVDDCEYIPFSPIRVAHKAIGRSLADTIIDLQKIRTTIMRLMLDGLSQSLVPRNAVNTQMVDEQGIDDLLDAEIGGVVRCKGDVRMAVGALQNPDVSAPALTALEYVDQKSEQQSGVTRHSQGIAPDAITKTASGIENLQAAANDRIELVARWAGAALEKVLQLALRLVVAHQDRSRWIKVQGKPLDVDPRNWSDEMGVIVHVGTAATPAVQITNLMAIAAKQEQAIQAGGPDNPVCNVTHLIHTYTCATELMGFKDPTKFWNAPDVAIQKLQALAAKPPPPDPKMLEVQQKGQIAQAQLQQDGQHKQQVLQVDTAHKQAEIQQKGQASEAEIALKAKQQQAEAALAERQQQAEAALAVRQQQFDEQLALQEQAFNQRLAIQQAAFDQKMAEKSADHTHQVALKKASMASNGKAPSVGRKIEMGGRPG